MTSKNLFAGILVCVSGAAFAHDTAFPHVHPHGADIVIMAIGIAALAWGGYKAGLFAKVRGRNDR